MKKHFSTIILIVVFFAGFSVLLYPAVSNYWNSRVQSRAIMDYESKFKAMDTKDYSIEFNNADRYNALIRQISYPLMYYDQVKGYDDLLNISGTGMIGYLDIEKLEVELPIYHGTSDAVLNSAVGHLKGTSLPVGGLNTHAVLSAHRGLPSAKLFTDLDKLEIGDVFTITVLDRILTYEVDQILIVSPEDVEALKCTEGKDYCTLVTCTPYGINSHRLLVRGTRIETITPKPKIFVSNEAYLIDPIIVTPAVAAPMLLLLLVILLIKCRKRK